MAPDPIPGHLGGVWRDTDGRPIQAHGAGVLHHEGVFYWFGEDKSAPTERAGICGFRTPALGVRCYASRDLVTWRDEGRVLASFDADPTSDLHPKNVLERPKVLFHRASGRFVMWLHVDRLDYDLGAVGVAVADRPTGPYRYLYTLRPGGADSRDFTVFADGDDAWLFHSAEWNKTMHVRPLAADWLTPAGVPAKRLFIGDAREAPAVFKARGRYWMLTSGCSGWDPNEARLAVADTPMGEWTLLPNPCVSGFEPELTWRAQSAFVLRLPGAEEKHLALFDRWRKEELGDSRYLWLPVRWAGEQPQVTWDDLFLPQSP